MAGPGNVYVSRGGVPFEANPEEASQLASAGLATPIAAQEAQDLARANRVTKEANESYGTAGKLGMGGLSGLTLGLGPGILAGTGIIDPQRLQAIQGSAPYVAGDIAGMAVPALAGDEAGLLGMSPAGLMGSAGSLSERLAAAVAGEAPGLLGRAASKTLSLAARGATEGALMNLGHTVGDSLITNKPLSAEALAASGIDGALFGGLIGGGVGALGHVGSLAVDAVDSGLGRLGGEAKAVSRVAKHLGYGEGEAGSAALGEGGLKNELKSAGEVIRKGGSDIGEAPEAQLSATRKASKIIQDERLGVIKELDDSGVKTPSVGRIEARIRGEVLAPTVGTPAEFRALKELSWVSGQLEKLGVSKTEPTWAKLVKVRDGLASQPMTQIRAEALNAIDSELRTHMAIGRAPFGGTELADKYGAATMQLKVAKVLEGTLGKKAAQKVLHGQTPAVSPRDLGVAGLIGISNPVHGAGWLAAKVVGNKAQSFIEPALARMAYNNSIGTKAAIATANVQNHIKTTLKKFFESTPRMAGAARTVSKNRGQPVSREAYEKEVSKVENLLSANHAERVRQYAEELHNQGYSDLAKNVLEVNQRAVQYVGANMPPRQGAKQMNSVRKIPVDKSLNHLEQNFLHIMKGTTKPTAILDDLLNGSLSTAQVKAVKFITPEIHTEVVSEATQLVYNSKVTGKYLPMDKIVKLGMLLDAPVDTMLQPDRIQAIQAAYASKNAVQPNVGPGNTNSNGPPQAPPVTLDRSLLTPMQQAIG